MFIHIGADYVVRSRDVVIILDSELDQLEVNQKFLQKAREEGRMIEMEKEECKSYIITSNHVYCSPISSLTLKRRASFVSRLERRCK
jgi:regulator of extracellular matrix RemA (YlzA/DUF370 family)